MVKDLTDRIVQVITERFGDMTDAAVDKVRGFFDGILQSVVGGLGIIALFVAVFGFIVYMYNPKAGRVCIVAGLAVTMLMQVFI